MEKIENVENPILGEIYLVKSIKCNRRNSGIPGNEKWTPIFGTWHREGTGEQPSPDQWHYHIDWRFMPESVILEQEALYLHYDIYKPHVKNTHLRSAVFESDEPIEEKYISLTFLRNFAQFDTQEFWVKSMYPNNKDILKFCSTEKMQNFICPHKGTNLKSCKIKNKSVQCPAHGLTWNIETGELITD